MADNDNKPELDAQLEDAVANARRRDEKGTLEHAVLDADIAFVDRAVAARILDLRRDATLHGGPMSEEDHREMDGVTRAWARLRLRLGRR